MNTIKVRLWISSHGYMAYSCDVDEGTCIFFDNGAGKFEFEWFNPAVARIQGGEVVETEEWQRVDSIQMLWTGKQDIKGVDIYQGDIVKTSSGRLCKVVWFDSPAFCGFYLNAINGEGYPPKGWRDLEIIGNVYENPELLNN